MKALRVKDGALRLEEIPVPKAAAGEAVVRVTVSGICNTDLEIVRGYAGFEGTIGHEFVGIVEQSAAKPELVGRRVVGEINAGCAKCELCLAGDPRHCPTRTVLGIVGRDGAHAEFLTLPTANLLQVPENITDEQAVFAEPLAAAYGITEQVKISNSTKLAVIGDGKLGLLCAMALSGTAGSLTIFGKHMSKMERVGPGIGKVSVAGLSSDFHRQFDVVIEASGSESGFGTALDLVRPRGKIVLKSTFHGTPTWAAQRVVVDEITIVGSRCGRFAPALELLSSGLFDVTTLIDRIIPLEDGIEAMKTASHTGVMKVLLSMDAAR